LLPCVNSICRTAVYVTRSYGGVGGRGEASSYPEYALDCRGHREFGNIHELMESRYGRFT
jgi:hypothetical protein